MQFTWDAAKAGGNRQKHGVTFEEAASVLYDPLALTAPDAAHSMGEDRERTIGRSDRSRILFVVTTAVTIELRQVKRIITARRATTFEEQLYADHLKTLTQGGRPDRRGKGGRGRSRR